MSCNGEPTLLDKGNIRPIQRTESLSWNKSLLSLISNEKLRKVEYRDSGFYFRFSENVSIQWYLFYW